MTVAVTVTVTVGHLRVVWTCEVERVVRERGREKYRWSWEDGNRGERWGCLGEEEFGLEFLCFAGTGAGEVAPVVYIE